MSLWEDQGPFGRDFGSHDNATSPQFIGGSIDFDGGDHLHYSGTILPTTTNFTLAVRFNPRVLTAGVHEIVAQYSGSSSNYYILRINNGAPLLAVSGTSIQSPSTIPLDTDCTLVTVRSGSNWALRVNGTQVSSGSNGGSIFAAGVVLGASSGTSGQWDAGWARYFNGTIKRVGVWSGALAGADLTTIEDWASNGG